MSKMKIMLALLMLPFVLSIGLAKGAEAATSDANMKALARGNNAFALQLFGSLSTTKGNLFCSPYSISSVLAMLYAGSGGVTKSQMEQVLHFGLKGEPLHVAFRRLTEGLLSKRKMQGYELTLANGVWVMKGQPIRRKYEELVKRDYAALAREVDFARNVESARRSINSWVENQSHGKFKDLIPEGVLSPKTPLVLISAIYFNGAWASRFDKKDTRARPFTLLNGEKLSVPMMRQTVSLNYMETESFQALELPYKGSELSMVVLLPKTHDGLTKMEASLGPQKVEKWLGQMRRTDVDVALPKFKVACKLALAETLQAMGLNDAFSSPPADFSGIDGTKELFIGTIIHEAVVDVTEKGTEAAAATAATIGATSVSSPIEFKADHPFLFMIRDGKSSGILFLGRVVNPAQ